MSFFILFFYLLIVICEERGEKKKTLKTHRSFSYNTTDIISVCLMESGFLETTFQTFLCLFVIRKVGQRKTLSSQKKIWFCFQGSVFLLF